MLLSRSQLKEYWNRISNHPATAKVWDILRRVIVIAVLGVIIYQLFDIGWKEVLGSLPTQPLFYIIFVVLYFTLPVAEVFIYRQLWHFPSIEGFKTFLKKKVYNEELMGYSGEVHLFMWGRKHVEKPDKEVLKDIRDNSILSAMTSNLVAVSLIAFLIFAGHIELSQLIGDFDLFYTAAGVVLAIILVVLIVVFRRYLFSLSPAVAAKIFSIYMVRFLIHQALMLMMWAVVIPGTPLSIWFTYLTVIIVINRIPFLPSKDLVFLWAGIELSHMLDMASAAVAGMLLVYSALKKVMNLGFFMLLTYYFKDVEVEEANPDKAKIPFAEADKKQDL